MPLNSGKGKKGIEYDRKGATNIKAKTNLSSQLSSASVKKSTVCNQPKQYLCNQRDQGNVNVPTRVIVPCVNSFSAADPIKDKQFESANSMSSKVLNSEKSDSDGINQLELLIAKHTSVVGVNMGKQKETKEGSSKQENINSGDDDDESSLHQQPKVMDIQIVLQMFKEIKADLNNFHKEVPAVKELSGQQKTNTDTISTLNKELDQQKRKNKIMTGTIERMAKVMNEMEDRITSLEKQNMKNSLILTGFAASEKKTDRNWQLGYFLKEALQVEIEIQDSFFLNSGYPKPVVMVFASQHDRDEVLRRKALLKDV